MKATLAMAMLAPVGHGGGVISWRDKQHAVDTPEHPRTSGGFNLHNSMGKHRTESESLPRKEKA